MRLYSRPRNDLTQRFPLIVEALARRSRSCILDGEAVACGEDCIALFERIRYQRHDGSVFLYAFDLIELNGDDLRREPLERRERRKAALARLLARAGHGVRLNAFRAELVFCAFKGPHGPGANNAGCEGDYSLHNVKSRPAKVGDKLTTHHFNTGTIGFAAPEDANTAVCVLPGTELAFATAIRCNRLGLLGWKPKVLSHTTAIFRQINKQNPLTHHNALEFPNGQTVLLTGLSEGQEATVLQLPVQAATPAEMKAQERVLHVG